MKLTGRCKKCGKPFRRCECSKNFIQSDVMPSLPTDDDIIKWSKEFNEDDVEVQAQFRVMAKFMRLCMKGNVA